MDTNAALTRMRGPAGDCCTTSPPSNHRRTGVLEIGLDAAGDGVHHLVAPIDVLEVGDVGIVAHEAQLDQHGRHVRRLQHPLSGSSTWVEYDGTSVVRKVLDGRANLVELRVEGAAGRIDGISLRLYNPQSRQWSLNFSNIAAGTLNQPTIGEFRNGRGEFYDQETLDGRAILVRFVISDITKDSCRFEQAFSADGGKTWELNWIATDTRGADQGASAG